MTHLSEQEFEEILQGNEGEFPHLAECQYCRNRLAEKQLLRDRLRSAFASVQARPGFAQHVADLVREASKPSAEIHSASGRTDALHRRRWPVRVAAAAAAAVLVIGIAAVIYLASNTPVNAAQAELVTIHQRNLSPDREFYTDADPAKLANYLKTHLGFTPTFPRLGQGMSIRGCCLAHFRDAIAGSYVVGTPQGLVSVIIVKDPPETLGIERTFRYDGHTFWAGSFAKNHMVVGLVGNYSYCVIGEPPLSHDMLTELLARLLPPTTD